MIKFAEPEEIHSTGDEEIGSRNYHPSLFVTLTAHPMCGLFSKIRKQRTALGEVLMIHTD